MSKRDDRVSLVDILFYAEEATEILGETSLEEMARDRVMQLALQRLGKRRRSGQTRFQEDARAT